MLGSEDLLRQQRNDRIQIVDNIYDEIMTNLLKEVTRVDFYRLKCC